MFHTLSEELEHQPEGSRRPTTMTPLMSLDRFPFDSFALTQISLSIDPSHRQAGGCELAYRYANSND